MIFNEETQELLSLVREFVDKEIIPTVGEYEKRDEFPVELLDKACAMGLNQLCIPAEYGGPGLSNVQVFAIAEQIARGDIPCSSPVRTHRKSCGLTLWWRRSSPPSA